ncbi:Neuronal pentraxin-1 [Microtus ochrogaster]|uniref:Pentraxin family member n=1 Tax=Microtus ochrogaster TaxID=79684 RepID=A0A8J6GPR7_MICOH|nr:Neuronal pentraxin-1 [Microtus ochrogaster]
MHGTFLGLVGRDLSRTVHQSGVDEGLKSPLRQVRAVLKASLGFSAGADGRQCRPEDLVIGSGLLRKRPNGEAVVAKLPFVINDGKWHHICVTWTTRDGVWEAYQDGTQGGNGENLAPYHPIKPQGVLVLGQEQDTLGGGFDATQAFVGELAHFNIWDRKLTPGEVYNLATCSSKALSGNVIAWTESQIEIFGGATKWTFEACRQIN